MTVSVVVPAFNEASRIDRLLEALLAQNYPREAVEILVVDNNSTDATRQVVERFPVTLLSESDRQNAEAARNRGIAAARGEVIAFTDGDCIPAADWLRAGLAAIADADLVAGRIDVLPSPARSPAELYDAVSNLRHDLSVRDRGVAFTANLFVRRSVVERLGGFNVDCFGGGDLIFTGAATSLGFRLVYECAAVVSHPARPAAALLTKALRIGREKGATARVRVLERTDARGRPKKGIRPHFQHLLPWVLGASLRARGQRVGAFEFGLVYASGWLYILFGLAGFVRGYAAAR